MLVVNLYAAPSSGKSTIRAGLFYELKKLGYNVEEVTEYAKELTWSESFNVLYDQLYVTANQNRRLDMLRDKVDIVITDSPLLLGLNYIQANYYPKHFRDLVYEVYDSYNNLEFFITRDVLYKSLGRNQTEEEASVISSNIKSMLEQRLTQKISRVSNTDTTLNTHTNIPKIIYTNTSDEIGVYLFHILENLHNIP